MLSLYFWFSSLFAFLCAHAQMPGVPLPEEGEIRVEFLSFSGAQDSQHAQYSRYRMLPGKKLALETSGFVSNGRFVNRSQNVNHLPISPFQIGIPFVDTSICSNLMEGKELPTKKVYQSRDEFNPTDVASMLSPEQEYDRNQISYLEIKQYTKNPLLDSDEVYVPHQNQANEQDFLDRVINQLPQIANSGGKFVANSAGAWRVVGGIRFVSGSVEGKKTPMSFEKNPDPTQPEVPSEGVLNIELSRLHLKRDLMRAQTDAQRTADLQTTMQVASQRIRVEMIAAGFKDPTKVWIYAHAVTPFHVRFYSSWKNSEEFWKRADGKHGIYRMRGDHFLRNYPAESLGGSPDLNWMRSSRALRSLYETHVQGNQKSLLHLRFFGNAMKWDTTIPQTIDSVLRHEILSYRLEDLEILEHYFMDKLGLGPRYLQTRLATQSLFKMNSYLNDHNLIKLDIPYRMSPQMLLSDFLIASMAVENIIERQGKVALEVFEKYQPKMVFFTRDLNVIRTFEGIPELSGLGISTRRMDRNSRAPFCAIVVDLNKLAKARRKPGEFSMTEGAEIRFFSEETSLRAIPDLGF